MSVIPVYARQVFTDNEWIRMVEMEREDNEYTLLIHLNPNELYLKVMMYQWPITEARQAYLAYVMWCMKATSRAHERPPDGDFARHSRRHKRGRPGSSDVQVDGLGAS